MPSNLWAPASGGEAWGDFWDPPWKFFTLSSLPFLSPYHCQQPFADILLTNLIWQPHLWVWILLNQNNQISDVRQTSGLVRCSWFQSGSSIAAWSPGRHSWDSSAGWTGVGQKGHRGPIMRDGGRIKQKALGSYGLASIHRPRLWMDPRAYSWLTNLLLLRAPVLIDPPTGWETATYISNWHLIPSVRCLDEGRGGGRYI